MSARAITLAQRGVLERLSCDGQVLRTPVWPSRSWMLGNGQRVMAKVARSLIDTELIEPKIDRERYVITNAGRAALRGTTRLRNLPRVAATRGRRRDG